VATLHDSRHCGANKRQSEGTCTRPAGWGTPHPGYGPCKLHGGSSRSVDGLVVEQQARELFGVIAPEIKPVDNPLEAYAALAGRVLAWMQLMDLKLGELSGLGYEHEGVGEQIQHTVQLYTQAMRDANTVLGTYARLRIDERLAAITEAKRQMLMNAIDAGLDENGIRGAEATAIKQATGRHLRIVKGA
jgi:hypothetical protein